MVKGDATNDSIVKMIGLYRVATRTTVATLLPAEVEPDKRLAKLVKVGLLRVHKGLPGNRSVYQLTKRGAAAAGVSPARGRIIGMQSLLKNMGVLLFCHAPGMERHRVEAEQLGKALGVVIPDDAYVLSRWKDKTTIVECYVPGPLTPVATILWRLKKQIRTAKSIPALADAIRDKRYGFAVIVASNSKKKTIMDAIRTRGRDEKLPLIKRARIRVEAIQELGMLFGTAGQSLGCVSSGPNQTLLWQE